MTVPPSISRTSIAAFAAWTTAVAIALASLIIYGGTAGPWSSPPSSWPSDSNIRRDTAMPTLLVFLHPECPCTRATLDNLEPVIADRPLSIVIVCPGDFEPSELEEDRNLGSCRQQLYRWKHMPNVTLVCDVDGQESERFRASTSGYCILFDASGSLCFSGGVTSSRGHRGANAGLASLRSILERSGQADTTYPVFGCPLEKSKCDQPTPARHHQAQLPLYREGCFHA